MGENYYQDQQLYHPASYSPQVTQDNTNPSPFLKAHPYGNDLMYSHRNSPGNISISQMPYMMSPTVTPQFEYSPQDQVAYSDQNSLQLTPPAMVQGNYNTHIIEHVNGQAEYSQNIEYTNRANTFSDSNSGVTPAHQTNPRRSSSESSKPPSNQKVKKLSNKEAEQLRRDKLKDAFKAVKVVLPFEKEKHPSKVFILKRAREHILDLEHDNVQKEAEIQQLKCHIEHLKNTMISRGLSVPYFRPYNRTERHSGENYISSEDEDD
ncbi:hypothetical protein HDV06_002733 [Boothiomyces sp. JEL0866]|nr:hypothetical protein HDV06_002733 [Boothiomyces sp. JEL0866]